MMDLCNPLALATPLEGKGRVTLPLGDAIESPKLFMGVPGMGMCALLHGPLSYHVTPALGFPPPQLPVVMFVLGHDVSVSTEYTNVTEL